MKYKIILDKYEDSCINISVRVTDPERVMIEADRESLIYLGEYIMAHAIGESCEVEVPLQLNVIGRVDDAKDLFIHRLPCDEEA